MTPFYFGILVSILLQHICFQHIAFLHVLAFRKMHLFYLAGHTGGEPHAGGSLDVAHSAEHTRHVLRLYRHHMHGRGLSAALSVLVSGTGGQHGGEQEQEDGKVEVPNVVGMTEEKAKETLNDEGLGFKVVAREESKKYEEGRVTEQRTKAGEKVAKNTTIEVVVSSKLVGETIKVPDVSGRDEA